MATPRTTNVLALVPSETKSGVTYAIVTGPEGLRCTCPSRERPFCKHVRHLAEALVAGMEPRPSTVTAEDPFRRFEARR